MNAGGAAWVCHWCGQQVHLKRDMWLTANGERCTPALRGEACRLDYYRYLFRHRPATPGPSRGQLCLSAQHRTSAHRGAMKSTGFLQFSNRWPFFADGKWIVEVWQREGRSGIALAKILREIAKGFETGDGVRRIY